MSELQRNESRDRAAMPINFLQDEATTFADEATTSMNEVRLATQERQSPVIQILDGDDIRADSMREDAFIRIVWYREVLPLPIINCVFLWQRYGTRNFRATIKRVSKAILTFTLKIIRFVLFLGHLYYWLSAILTDGSMATYSDKYFGDILSYSFRNYPQIVERHCEITQAKASFQVLEYRNWRSFLYDLVALNLGAKYHTGVNGVVCELNYDSLIYKFSDAVTKSAVLNQLPSASITIFTVCIYLIYGLAASVLKINMAIMFGVNIYHRLSPAGRLVANLVKSLWYQTSPSLF